MWLALLNSDGEPANARIRINEMFIKGQDGAVGFIWSWVSDPSRRIQIRVYRSAPYEQSYEPGEEEIAARDICTRLNIPYDPLPSFGQALLNTQKKRVAPAPAPTQGGV